METATAGFESLLRYQEMLFLVLLAMLMIAACLMSAVCLLLLWLEGSSIRRRAALPTALPTPRAPGGP